MDRRTFLSTTGALITSSGNSETAKADGYPSCEQLHEKLTPERIDKWTQELRPGYTVYPEVLSEEPTPPIGEVCCPKSNAGKQCVSQGVAPEYFWTFPDIPSIIIWRDA